MVDGRNISLRPIRERDLDSFFLLMESAGSFIEFFPRLIDSEYLFKQKFAKSGLWDDNEGYCLIINHDKKIIGMISYLRSNFLDAYDLSYIIFEEENRGKGFMKEALSLFSKFLFANKTINRLQLSIPDYHRASIAIAQKCGYTFEGISREAIFSRGKYLDLCVYSMLRKECKNIDKLY